MSKSLFDGHTLFIRFFKNNLLHTDYSLEAAVYSDSYWSDHPDDELRPYHGKAIVLGIMHKGSDRSALSMHPSLPFYYP